ncbi:MAG: RNA 2',3'-cyclic phosphodiesterase [Oscillospiraceae bacterium]|nr:RNA 2',3'-cyclic phosphodiesterase [Oscillospiraceae bacterium]
MRLFIAISLSNDIRTSITDCQEMLRASGVKGSWSPTENLHLTLAFIGEYRDPDEVLDAVGTVSFDPFDLRVRGLGSFSDTLWAGIEKNEVLEKLVRSIRGALASADIPFDRKKFRPHITLARRSSVPTDLSSLSGPSLSVMTVDSFSLFRSDRGKHGMIYTELGRISASPSAERN